MNEEARKTVFRTRLLHAKNELVEAAEWKARAEARLREAETKLFNLLEDAMSAPSPSALPEEK